MKILIIGFAKIKYMPYMNFYLDNLDREINDIHVLYWNRDLCDENLSKLQGTTLHEFRCYQEDQVSKISKIGSFIKFRKYANGIIKKSDFDFIFVLHSLPGVLIADKLKKQFSDKYIFDYRDSTYEGFAPYKKVIGKLVHHSKATFVSSDAFRRFLPEDEKDKIFTSHNILLDSLSHSDDKEKFGVPSDKIRMSFWGFIRHEELNIEIIKKISADNRFELHYYGKEQQVALNLKKYVLDNKIDNVFFHGEYKPEDRYEFIKTTDIIHNIYFDDNMMLAMGNKYYDGVIFRIPQVCMLGSFMAECAEKSGVGFGCNPYDADFTDKIYEWISMINKEKFRKDCQKEECRTTEEYYNGCKFVKMLWR